MSGCRLLAGHGLGIRGTDGGGGSAGEDNCESKDAEGEFHISNLFQNFFEWGRVVSLQLKWYSMKPHKSRIFKYMRF
jgi:hypothetical protein